MTNEFRAFIAIELPSRAHTELSRVIAEMRTGHERSVKWVDPGIIHLTLKFLGNIPYEKASDISEAIRQAARTIQPFPLELNGIGAFPDTKAPRVIWAGVGGDITTLRTLQKQIDQALIPLGFAPEARGFSPHLTLGRVRDGISPQQRLELGKKLGSIPMPTGIAIPVTHVHLMKSTLTPRGPLYERVSVIPLAPPAQWDPQMRGGTASPMGPSFPLSSDPIMETGV